MIEKISGENQSRDALQRGEKLAGRFPPRVRAKELWRVAEPYLQEAWEDATRIAIRAQEDAGLDIITDGEIRRESYSNRFATALEGVDLDNPGTALDRSGHPNPVPRISGRIRRKHAVEVEDLLFLKKNTTRKTKITVPGPFTMSCQAQNDFYATDEEAAMDYAVAVNAEIKDLFAAGAEHIALTHRSFDRRAYATGAVRAARRSVMRAAATPAPVPACSCWSPCRACASATAGPGGTSPLTPVRRSPRRRCAAPSTTWTSPGWTRC